MKRSTKKGFTIVELVIVIAVIAILAAVLIPTFSSLIKRANLSADMQAVRTINLALQTAEAKNGKPANADQAMLIIADAGYDVATYHPLTKGYEIYWVDTVNRVILYSTTDSEVVYPDDYVELTNDNTWHLLNESYKNAMNEDFAGIVSDDGKNFDVTKTQTAEEAGSILYAIFVQQDEKKIDKDVKVELPKEVDVSNYIWKPVKNFSGELIGDAEGTVISGVTLDESVSFSQSATFAGSGSSVANASKYNVYGFIDMVCGTATIKDITFEDFNLIAPGSDFNNTGVSSNANVIAPIGCIYPGANKETANVTIENVHVKNGTIEGLGRVGGLVGYIGGPGQEENNMLTGSVTIKNCTVDNVTMKAGLGTSPAYGTVGGLISYIVRSNNLAVTVDNCSVTNCTMEGQAAAAGVVGWFNPDPDNADDAKKSSFTLNVVDLTLTGNTMKKVGTVTSVGGGESATNRVDAGLIAGGNCDYKNLVTVTFKAQSDNTVTSVVESKVDTTARMYTDNTPAA